MIGNQFDADKRAFDFMLKLDTVRGHHSTGVARIENIKRDQYQVVKNVGTPWDMIKDKPKEYYNNGNGVLNGDYAVLMGHNRWATVGKIDEENAHPFVAGNIIGAHNGTIPQYQRTKLEDHQYYQTDSEAIFFNFDKNGVKETINKIQGAWALTWYNFADDTFNILRNKERPLFFAWKKGGKVMYYASEPEFIYMATDKYNIDLEEDENGDSVFSFKTDTHYAFKLGKLFEFGKQNVVTQEVKEAPSPIISRTPIRTIGGTTKSAKDSANVFTNGGGYSSVYSSKSNPSDWVGKKGKYVEFTVSSSIYLDEQKKEYIPASVVNDNTLIRIYPSYKVPDLFSLLGDREILTFTGKLRKVKIRSNSNTFYLTLDAESIIPALVKDKKKNDEILAASLKEVFDDSIPFKGEEKLFPIYKRQVTEAEYRRAVRIGCCWCSYDPEPEDASEVHWYNNETFLCKDCNKDPETVRYTEQYVCSN